MKLLKLVLEDAFADIGMADLNFDRLNQLGIQDEIESAEEPESSEAEPEQDFQIQKMYSIANADAGMNENVYKLTEIFLPSEREPQLKRDLCEFLDRQIRGNVDKYLSLTDQENQWKRKREIKEQMKLTSERALAGQWRTTYLPA